MIYFPALSNGEISISQGPHEVKRIVYESIINSSLGLLIRTPLYYFITIIMEIVTAMIVISIAIIFSINIIFT